MKRIPCVFIILLLLHVNLNGQVFKQVLDAQQLTWFGLNFSKAKMVGDFRSPQTNSAKDVRDNFYTSLNALILNEPLKFNLRKYIINKDFNYNIEVVSKINTQINPDSIEITGIYQSKPFSKEKLQAIINEYKTYQAGGLTGVGVTFVIEKFDNVFKNATADIIFFNIQSGEIMLYEQLQAQPNGFGLRNHWAGAIHRMLKFIPEFYWERWKRS